MKYFFTVVAVFLFGIGHVSSCLAPPPPPPQPQPQPQPPPQPPTSSCRCGVSSQTKIVGGSATARGEYPWQVALKRNSNNGVFCGGSLLDGCTILTAAHCKMDINTFKVVLGDYQRSIVDGTEVVREVESWTNHPDYNRGASLNNDFAILKLKNCPVPFSNNVSPICLPRSSSSNFLGRTAYVSGWGTLSSGGGQPQALNDVDVQVKQCSGYSPNQITSSMICASNSGKDSCQGDSGGPLVALEGSSYSLVGVVSWGYGCAQARYPGVYAKTTSQLSWIRSRMSGPVCSRS